MAKDILIAKRKEKLNSLKNRLEETRANFKAGQCTAADEDFISVLLFKQVTRVDRALAAIDCQIK